MDFLRRIASENGPDLSLFLISAVILLTIIVLVQWRSARLVQRRWMDLMKGVSGANLEHILSEHLTERRRLEASVGDLDQRVSVHEKKMASCLRYIGVVRYDAFDDVGATQSWSMAFFDEDGNGAVITCLYGRHDCRVYSKVLERGKSDRSLTGEEQSAIEAAGRGGRTVIRA